MHAPQLQLKQVGFCDKQIANECHSNEMHVRQLRKGMDVLPIVKQIDTLAAEFPAQTNYLYMTYNGSEHDVEFDDNSTSCSEPLYVMYR